jgi:hypothetical protein
MTTIFFVLVMGDQGFRFQREIELASSTYANFNVNHANFNEKKKTVSHPTE